MSDLIKNGEPSSRASMAISAPRDGSIALYLVNGVATVWDAQVAAQLHCVHNVSGLRAGTLPGVAQQNGFLGLPLTLTKEEAAYLVQEGICHLIPLPTFPPIPSQDEIQAHTLIRQTRIMKLEALARAQEDKRKAEASARFKDGGEKARAKREARAKAKAEKERARAKRELEEAEADGEGGGGGGEGESLFDAGGSEEGGRTAEENWQGNQSRHRDGPTTKNNSSETVGDEVDVNPEKTSQSVQDAPGPKASDEATSLSTPTATTATATTPAQIAPDALAGHFHAIPSHPSHPDITFSSSSDRGSSAITSLPHPLYPFPSTPRDRALVGVFTELQRRGYRMGLGPRFGGEYLIYPGDYLRYHAHFTSQILVRDEHIRPAELVAWGRLGTGTKKAGLICAWDDGLRTTNAAGGAVDQVDMKGETEFYSLEWANFG